MNDEAREILVAAALRGHRQIRGQYHDPDEAGDCALGVLHALLHTTRADALLCTRTGLFGHSGMRPSCADQLAQRFGIIGEERFEIAAANDERGWDFLTIARKVGHADR